MGLWRRRHLKSSEPVKITAEQQANADKKKSKVKKKVQKSVEKAMDQMKEAKAVDGSDGSGKA